MIRLQSCASLAGGNYPIKSWAGGHAEVYVPCSDTISAFIHSPAWTGQSRYDNLTIFS